MTRASRQFAALGDSERVGGLFQRTTGVHGASGNRVDEILQSEAPSTFESYFRQKSSACSPWARVQYPLANDAACLADSALA